MSVHARFSLQEATRIKMYAPGDDGKDGKWVPVEGVRVRLAPVQGEPFGSATPGGNLEMVIANRDAAALFNSADIGQEFDAVFSPVQEHA